jgi:hypothetical protein
VSLVKDEDGYPPYEAEELDASPATGASDRYRVESVPVFAYGLARGDVVKVVRVVGDARLWVAEVVEHSRHWTTRLLCREASEEEAVAEFTGLGCHAYSTPFGLVALDVPPGVSVSATMQELENGRISGRWDFDLGVKPGASPT